MPELLLGSADLTPSNNTRTKGLKEVTPDDFSGRYIHYGIREMGMAAAMNGIFHPWRLCAGGRHLPVFHRLCAALDADRGAVRTCRWSTS